MTGRAPLPLTPENAAARRRRIAELRDAVRRGAYRIPAARVAEALLEQVRGSRRTPDPE